MTINVAAIQNVIAEYAPQMFVNTLTKRSYLWNKIPKAPPSSPQGPRWQAKTAGHTGVSTFADGGTFPVADEFERAKASLDWGRYVGTIKITGDADDQLRLGGDLYIANYVNEQTTEVVDALVDLFCQHIKAGTATNGFVGLTTAIDDTGTYANLSRSTYSVWQSYVNDNGGSGRNLTLALMRTVHNQITQTIGGDYNEIWTTQEQIDAFTGLGSGVPTPQINIANGQTTATFVAGYGGPGNQTPGAWFKGRPMYAIPGYATGRMDFVDTRGFAIEELRRITMRGPKQVNDDFHFDLTWKGQLKLTNPRKQAASLQDLN